MADTGWFVNAGEVRTEAGEPEMQAGNYPSSSANVNATEAPDNMISGPDYLSVESPDNVLSGPQYLITERPDIPIIGTIITTIHRGEIRVDENPDTVNSDARLGRSWIDTQPHGDIPSDGLTDVWLFNTLDGGQLYLRNSDLVMTNGAETAVYISLFGGNELDDGQPGNRETWWGNVDIDDENQSMVSRYQNLADSLPAKASNINRLRDAALADLAWLEEYGYSVSVDVTIPERDRFSITISVDDQTITF